MIWKILGLNIYFKLHNLKIYFKLFVVNYIIHNTKM